MEELKKLEIELHQLTTTSLGRRAFLASLPMVLSACASQSKHRFREGKGVENNVTLTPDQEYQMALEYIPQMEKEYPTINNSYLQGYISDVGRKIAIEGNYQNNPYKYQFKLVDAKMINAFALPAGFVYVTKPLLAATESEAELAGVIGHEIGHIQARHTAQRISQAKKSEKNMLLGALGGAILGGAAGYGLSKYFCKKEDRECIQRITKYGAMAGGAGGLLIQKFAFMANSREDEMEADRIGFRASVNSGFHPQYVGNFYSKLLQMEQAHQSGSKIEQKFADAMSTHPPGKDRVAQMNELSSELSGRTGVISSQDYKKVKAMI